MSADFIELFRKRVDDALKPHLEIYGETSPVVKMGLRLLAEAEQLEQVLAEEKVSTARAAEVTGWHPETLQQYARLKLAGAQLPPGWELLVVERTPAGYAFNVGTIPPRASAA